MGLAHGIQKSVLTPFLATNVNHHGTSPWHPVLSSKTKSEIKASFLILTMVKADGFRKARQQRQTASVCRTSHLLAAGFETTACLTKTGLHGDHTELPVFHFAMRGHHPDKVDRMSRH